MSAPFRITRPPSAKAGAMIVAAPAAPGEDLKYYLDRLLKMIPAEVVSLYLVGSSLIPADQTIALAIWAAVCLVGTVLVRAYGTADPAANKKPDWVHVAISSVSFVIWTYSLGGPFEAYGLHTAYLGSLLVLAWTFFVPLFYKGPAD
jgi:hypothetical protein